jgi:hypothetical protein
MSILGGIIGIAFGFALIKYRETIGGMVGDPAWASKVGGIYNVLIIVGILICFWSLAVMTGTTDILFGPILSIFKRGPASGAADRI